VNRNDLGIFSPINQSGVSVFWDMIGSNIYLSRSRTLGENLMKHPILKRELLNPKDDSRQKYDDNVKEIIREIQEIYPHLQIQIKNVEEDLDIDKVFLRVGSMKFTESGKKMFEEQGMRMFGVMDKPWWKFWK
jgi:hypothetical protein